jgi:hypothetical protein
MFKPSSLINQRPPCLRLSSPINRCWPPATVHVCALGRVSPFLFPPFPFPGLPGKLDVLDLPALPRILGRCAYQGLQTYRQAGDRAYRQSEREWRRKTRVKLRLLATAHHRIIINHAPPTSDVFTPQLSRPPSWHIHYYVSLRPPLPL